MNFRLSLIARLGRKPWKRRAKILDRALRPEPWYIDVIRYDGEAITIKGWALAPKGRHDLLSFTVNDHEFEEIEFPFWRPDVSEIFWYKSGSKLTGFRCRSRVTPAQLFKDGYSVLKCVNRRTGLPLRAEFNIYYPMDKGPELPDAERRLRVWGTVEPTSFLFEGYSTFKKLDLALLKTVNRPLSDFADVLDWGCGCGRVTRNFYALPKTRVFGIDVDEDNVGWCRDHLNFGNYRVAPLRPPTDLPSRSFDLIIGISVLSHLGEQNQREWLAELSRLAKPGAILLLSTLGKSAAARSYWMAENWHRWQRSGFAVNANDSNVPSVTPEDDYYVTAFLTESYIRKNWSSVFEILDFIPSYISNHQDLVVMRKPA